ncbi:MAG TPA: NAD(P)-dependent oxidoreductase [Candidatus Rubrimentiphilum sp.]|nr:NAD(P)-dependent oxidoreductase [Candidatus Rubrimentiphilum sp.]
MAGSKIRNIPLTMYVPAVIFAGAMRNPYFPVGLNLAGRHCVVIGNDREADEKSAALRECDADVRRIEDAADLRDEDVSGAFLVISTPQNEALSARLRALADRERFLLCCIDQPKHGFVAMLAIAKAGPVRVAISTAGLAPRIGKLIKEGLQRAMDARFAKFAEAIAARREDVREKHPAPEDLPVRRNAMIEAARGFEVDVSFGYPGWFEEL